MSHQFLVAVDMKKHFPPQLCQPGLQRAWTWVRLASVMRSRIMLRSVLMMMIWISECVTLSVASIEWKKLLDSNYSEGSGVTQSQVTTMQSSL